MFVRRLLNHSSIYEYTGSDRHDGLVQSLIVALMKNGFLMRGFDYLFYSAMMYQLQEYTKSEISFEIFSLDNTGWTMEALRHLIMKI